MRSRVLKSAFLLAVTVSTAGGTFACHELPEWAAGGLLFPMRKDVSPALRNAHETVTFVSGDATLYGWKFRARGTRKGTVVYLHGVADNRVSGIGAAERLTKQSFDAVVYDSRAHGQSTGAFCTYGFYEKRDLLNVIDSIPVDAGPVVVMGHSLGAAVALQAAGDDTTRRIRAVVAAESFSDLRTVAVERVRWFLTPYVIRRGFEIAEARAQFNVDSVSPVLAASRIRVPVLVIHGRNDWETLPAHSQRIYDALAGPKRLLMVDGVGHDQSLTPGAWQVIEEWLQQVLQDDPR